MLPNDLIETLTAYRDHGRPTGGFLQAVLENNLMEAMGRADHINRHMLFDICQWVYDYMPSVAWGDRERVTAWIKQRGLEGFQKEVHNV